MDYTLKWLNRLRHTTLTNTKLIPIIIITKTYLVKYVVRDYEEVLI